MRISIIVPMLNEAPNLASTLESTLSDPRSEVILVDGGSRDGTLEVARSYRMKLLLSEAGRARQMNAGALEATGEVLLFLHADTRLPRGYENHVRQTLEQTDAIAGAFELRIDGPETGLRVVEQMANWRSRLLQMPYGDQGVFVRSDVFWDLGGFSEVPILEDFDLVRRLRRRGRISIVPASVLTSARRWHELGICRTTVINLAAVLAHGLGVEPSRIHRLYYRRSGRFFGAGRKTP